MKWITRERAKVDRIACPWLIRRFIDPAAEFLYVPADEVATVAAREGAIPFDVPGVELGHTNGRCSFEAILTRYGLQDPALRYLARIVHAADVPADRYQLPEGPGLLAIAEGFAALGLPDDHAILDAQSPVYDALYAYCQTKVLEGVSAR
jgi:hypothetical protein